MNTASLECLATCVGMAVAIFFSTIMPSARFVSSARRSSSASDGFARSIFASFFACMAW